MKTTCLKYIDTVAKTIPPVLMGGVMLSLLACSATQKAPITRAA